MMKYFIKCKFSFSIITITILLSQISCKTQNKTHESKERLLEKYLSIENRLAVDTTSEAFKFLQAYRRNDTATMIKFTKSAERANKFSALMNSRDSCVYYEKKPGQIWESYRFRYRKAFCPLSLEIVLNRFKDHTEYETILFQSAEDTTPCKLISRKSGMIDEEGWLAFKQEILYSDFGGMNTINGEIGLDGDGLTVFGFVKGSISFPDRNIEVSRWLPGRLPINRTFLKSCELAFISPDDVCREVNKAATYN